MPFQLPEMSSAPDAIQICASHLRSPHRKTWLKQFQSVPPCLMPVLFLRPADVAAILAAVRRRNRKFSHRCRQNSKQRPILHMREAVRVLPYERF